MISGCEICGDSLHVSVYAGVDPVTGKRVYLRETISGADSAAHKRAMKRLDEFLVRVGRKRTTPSAVRLGYAVYE